MRRNISNRWQLDTIEFFKTTIRAHGLEPPDTIQPGKMHRFPGLGKKLGDDAAWCKLFDDMRGGVFGDFSTSLDEHWQIETESTYTAEERAVFKRRIETERQQRQKEDLQRHEAAAQRAVEILAAAGADPRLHPYALKKAVDLGPLVKRGAWSQRGWTDALLINIAGGRSELTQSITNDLVRWRCHGVLWSVINPMWEGLRSLGFKEALLDPAIATNEAEIKAKLQAWHDYLEPDSIWQSYEDAFAQVAQLSDDEQLKRCVHGKYFYEQVVNPLLN
ncbi:MAG: hypothetical protein IBX56_16825 [Methylomicrobium sp.]|nr:hypothetical protein [Methylomicrobium sp.]